MFTGLPVTLPAMVLADSMQMAQFVSQESKRVFVSAQEVNPFVQRSYHVAIPLSGVAVLVGPHILLLTNSPTQTVFATIPSIGKQFSLPNDITLAPFFVECSCHIKRYGSWKLLTVARI